MATEPRRFDELPRFASDTRLDLEDIKSTFLARLGMLRFPRVVAATSEVTSPYTGQLVFNTTDNMIYRYDGSAWVACIANGGNSAATMHEARYEQTALQTVANNTDTKLQFNTAVTTCNDVTASGTGNQDFLLNRAGVWDVSASARFVGAAGAGERHMFLTTGTTIGTVANRFVGTTSGSGTFPFSLAVSTTIRVAASTSVCAGVWQSSGGNLNTDVGFGHSSHIALTWRRPL